MANLQKHPGGHLNLIHVLKQLHQFITTTTGNNNKQQSVVTTTRTATTAKVAGAFKNLISPERMFLKSYVQFMGGAIPNLLLEAMYFLMTGHVILNLTKPGELVLHHFDGNVDGRRLRL